MAEHNSLGNWGEQVVVDYLVSKGYAITARNWRLNHLEIDIIATIGDEIVFVEVKTRRSNKGNPLEAMTQRKVHLLSMAANAYLQANHVLLRPRFDVAAVAGDIHSHEFTYIPNAFMPPLRSYR